MPHFFGSETQDAYFSASFAFDFDTWV